ncbi:sensor histidine kinase [Pedobacter sp. HMWF019]|uniref:sensor histidine kinase n=1 Tax=Pedobacter sp. HMWF019 TaxID=2056856 RepID=UPI001304C829|nr:histidine kinase [Pedobacter sp. HMWF019]
MWYQRKQIALQTELNFIKGQIHPHFLFNTLNNLYALTLRKSAQSSEIVLELSQILRYMLYECNAANVKLSRDIEILRSYLKLEKIRYQNGIEMNINITGDTQQNDIAPLLMLTLVENAFKHGTSETINHPWITIDIQINANRLTFRVANSKSPNQSDHAESHFKKIGLQNIQKRLDIHYKKAHKFTIRDQQDTYIAILELTLSDRLYFNSLND